MACGIPQGSLPIADEGDKRRGQVVRIVAYQAKIVPVAIRTSHGLWLDDVCDGIYTDRCFYGREVGEYATAAWCAPPGGGASYGSSGAQSWMSKRACGEAVGVCAISM